MKKTVYDLIPTDGRKSYYGKAKVMIYPDGTKGLVSYETEVLRVTPDEYIIRQWSGYSATTLRHIKAFMEGCGVDVDGVNKKWWVDLPLHEPVPLNIGKVTNKYGVKVYYNAAASLMDDELREQLHADLSPCTNQAFFDAYCAAHMLKYGESFELDKENPVY